MKNGGLTAKQDRFCREYVVDLNASRAARKAGYKAKTARQQGQRLLTKVDVQQRIAELQAEVTHRLGIKAENVLHELTRIGFSNIADYLEFGPNGVTLRNSEDLNDNQLAAVAEIIETITKHGRNLRFKLHDKLSALEKLGKHLKLFTEKVEVEEKSMAQVVSEMRKKRLERERAEHSGATGS